MAETDYSSGLVRLNVASMQVLRSTLSSQYVKVKVSGYYGSTTGGGDFDVNSSDTTSGAYGIGSITGNALSITTLYNGTYAIGQQINYPGSDGSVYIISGTYPNFTLNKSPGNVTGVTITGDNGGTVVALDGMRWTSSTDHIQVVDTFAALAAIPNPGAADSYLVRGNSSVGDGGGGFYFWNSTDSTAANGGTVIASSLVVVGRFNKLF